MNATLLDGATVAIEATKSPPSPMAPAMSPCSPVAWPVPPNLEPSRNVSVPGQPGGLADSVVPEDPDSVCSYSPARTTSVRTGRTPPASSSSSPSAYICAPHGVCLRPLVNSVAALIMVTPGLVRVNSRYVSIRTNFYTQCRLNHLRSVDERGGASGLLPRGSGGTARLDGRLLDASRRVTLR